MGKKEDWLEKLDPNDIEEFKRANSYLQLSLDHAKMRGYDRIDSGHWAIAHAGYYSAMQSEITNQVLVELVTSLNNLNGTMQNISAKLSEISFKQPDG